MTIICSLPPSINATYKTNRKGGFYKSQEAKDWTEACQWEVRKHYKHSPLTSQIYLGIDFMQKMNRDIDNGLKLIIDALQGLVYDNDRQVVHLNVRKFEEKENPRVEIQVEEIVL
jgi:crossover junction endodeoxyribonuclease RusA